MLLRERLPIFFHVHESNDVPMSIKIPKLGSCWQSIYIMLNCSHVECGSHGYKSDREPSSGLVNMFSQKGRKLQLCLELFEVIVLLKILHWTWKKICFCKQMRRKPRLWPVKVNSLIPKYMLTIQLKINIKRNNYLKYLVHFQAVSHMWVEEFNS